MSNLPDVELTGTEFAWSKTKLVTFPCGKTARVWAEHGRLQPSIALLIGALNEPVTNPLAEAVAAYAAVNLVLRRAQ